MSVSSQDSHFLPWSAIAVAQSLSAPRFDEIEAGNAIRHNY